jgi:hypothetical protein
MNKERQMLRSREMDFFVIVVIINPVLSTASLNRADVI